MALAATPPIPIAHIATRPGRRPVAGIARTAALEADTLTDSSLALSPTWRGTPSDATAVGQSGTDKEGLWREYSSLRRDSLHGASMPSGRHSLHQGLTRLRDPVDWLPTARVGGRTGDTATRTPSDHCQRSGTCNGRRYVVMLAAIDQITNASTPGKNP